MNFILILQTLVLITIVSMFLFIIYERHMEKRFKGAYFLRTKKKQINTILEYVGDEKTQKIVDLGSGDGRLLIALGKKGFNVDGYEISTFLYFISLLKIFINKVDCKVFRENYWSEDLSKYDVTIVYGIGYMMEDMKDKLWREMKKDSKIISIRFKFENMETIKEKNNVYLYKV